MVDGADLGGIQGAGPDGEVIDFPVPVAWGARVDFGAGGIEAGADAERS